MNTSERPVVQTVFIPAPVWRQNPWLSSLVSKAPAGVVARSWPQKPSESSVGCALAGCAAPSHTQSAAANTSRFEGCMITVIEGTPGCKARARDSGLDSNLILHVSWAAPLLRRILVGRGAADPAIGKRVWNGAKVLMSSPRPSRRTLGSVLLSATVLAGAATAQPPPEGITDTTIAMGVEAAGTALTRERFIQAMEGIVDWDAGGVLPNVSFSATNHHAQRAGFICEMQDGRLVALTDWIAP